MIGGLQYVLQFVRIADQKNLCPGRFIQKVVFPLCAGILRQFCTLAAAGVADGSRAGDRVLQQIVQPVLQFLVIGGCIDRDADLAEEGCIIDALMGLAVCRDKAGAVDGKDHILLQQVDVVDDLVIGALQEGGVDAHHRQHSLTGKTGRKGDSMLLRHAHIKKALRVTMGKELQSGTVLHGSGDRAELRVLCSLLHQQFAENSGEGFLRRNLRVRHSVRVKSRYTVIVSWVHLCRLITFTLFGHNMQKMGTRPLIDRAQGAFQLLHVVAIHRADVFKAHILKHGGVVHSAAYQRFCADQRFFHRRTNQWHTVQKTAYIILGIIIRRSCAQMGQIPCQCTDIFRDGHLVIVQDHEQVVQPADIVHPLIHHAAGKSAIADHRHHKPGLMLDLFGPSHTNSE